MFSFVSDIPYHPYAYVGCTGKQPRRQGWKGRKLIREPWSDQFCEWGGGKQNWAEGGVELRGNPTRSPPTRQETDLVSEMAFRCDAELG